MQRKAIILKEQKGCPRERLCDIDPERYSEEDGYTRKDYFLEAYIGRDYGDSAFEILSNGFEYAYTNPDYLKQDKDMRNWILKMLLFG